MRSGEGAGIVETILVRTLALTILSLQLEVILCLKSSVSVHLKYIVRRVENNKVTTRKYKKGPNKPEKIGKY